MKKKFILLMTALLTFSALPINIYANDNQVSKSSEKNRKNVIIGARNQEIEDITLVETSAGAWKSDKSIYLRIEHIFFEDNPKIEVIEGDIKIKEVSVKDGILKVDIEKSSSKIPAKIKLYNLSVIVDGTTPTGTYNLELVTEESEKYKNNAFGLVYSEDGDGATFDRKYQTLISNYVRVVNSLEEVYLSGQTTLKVGKKEMIIDDKTVEIDAAPYMSDNNIMVPLRAVAEAIKGKDNISIIWDEKTKTVTLMMGARIITMQEGSSFMNIRGSKIPMEGKIEIRDNRIFISADDIGRALISNVSWNEDTKTVIFN